MRHITPALALAALAAAALAPRLLGTVDAAVPPTPVAPTTTAPPATFVAPVTTAPGEVGLTVTLDRSTVLPGGQIRARIDLQAPTLDEESEALPTDLVLVLDRSGSMSNGKMRQAKQAATELIGMLGEQDRVAIVSFSRGSRVDMPLTKVTSATYQAITNLRASGGTHMVDGLRTGLNVLDTTPGRSRRVVLLSDGHPNSKNGLVELGQGAAIAETPVTTVGIGSDYDAVLLQQIADAGTGNAYWANPRTPLAAVFADEFQSSRTRVATTATLSTQATPGVRVVDWGGLPVTHGKMSQSVALGSLFSGQKRSIWVTLQVEPGVDAEQVSMGAFSMRFDDREAVAHHYVAEAGNVTVTADRTLALSGLDHRLWEQSVVQEEYNAMLGNVTQNIAKGNQQAALQELQAYQAKNYALNEHVQSAAVTGNLAEVQKLEQDVKAQRVGKTKLLDLTTRSYQGRRAGSNSFY